MLAEEAIPEVIEEFDPLAPDDNAPWGYTVDRKTGERRAKKTMGRPVKAAPDSLPPMGESPDLEFHKAAKKNKDDDIAPGALPKKRSRAKEKPEAAVVPYRAGVIAKGMNKMYAQAGKIIRAMDPDIGEAIISCTRKESEDDVTVGEAWDELARTNPRVRAFLMKLMTGNAWRQLFWAHLPILLAVVMKENIRKHLPFQKVVNSVLEPDEETGAPSDISAMLGNLSPEDVEQMMPLVNSMMGQMGFRNMENGRVP